VLGKAHWGVSLDDYRLSRNPDDLDFYTEFDLDDLDRPGASRAEELATLAARARSTGLLHALAIVRGIDDGRTVLVLQFPAGESTRNLFIDAKFVNEALESSFEEFEYLDSYDGIWSARQGRIEALIEYGRGGELAHYRAGPQEPRSLEARAESGAVVRVGKPSAEAIAMLDTRIVDSFRKLTLSIEGLSLGTCVEAEATLDTVGNSFLLQVEAVIGDLPHLVTRYRRDPWTSSDWKGGLERSDETELVYPSPPLRIKPAKMYLYARRISRDLPVVRFLAFYQVIEYFFPVYARMHIVEQLQVMLQSPKFDPHSAPDIEKLVDTIPSGGRRGLGNEFDQLRATLNRCVDIVKLRTLLDNGRQDHSIFAGLTSQSQPLGCRPLPIDHKCRQGKVASTLLPGTSCRCDDALLKALAQRIYALRNRIVHAKEESECGEEEPVFAFMPQADYLDADIELLSYIARNVLTAPNSADILTAK